MTSPGSSGSLPGRGGPLAAIGFIAPPSIVYGIFVLVPILLSSSYSFYGGEETPSGPFVGLANYRTMVHDPIFWDALGHNIALLVLSVLIQIPLALIFASILTAKIPFRTFLRAAYFVPMILPTPAIGNMWERLLNGTSLMSDHAFWTLAGVVSWRHVGFHTVLIMAGIESIDRELYQAARVDGAGRWETFRHITLPLSLPVVRICALLSVLGSLRYFDLAWILWSGSGGPGQSAELVATYMFRKAFVEAQMGYASAVATALFVTSGAVALVMLAGSRWAERREAQWA